MFLISLPGDVFLGTEDTDVCINTFAVGATSPCCGNTFAMGIVWEDINVP